MSADIRPIQFRWGMMTNSTKLSKPFTCPWPVLNSAWRMTSLLLASILAIATFVLTIRGHADKFLTFRLVLGMYYCVRECVRSIRNDKVCVERSVFFEFYLERVVLHSYFPGLH